MVSEISRVAVIGAGVSGLSTARHLKSQGLEVVVFERSARAGGVWAYDDRQPLEPEYPSVKPSVADFVIDDEAGSIGSTPKENNTASIENKTLEQIILGYAPPGPAYDGLTNNISTVLQELKGHPWKAGIGDFVNVRVAGDYLESYSKSFDVETLTKFNTRVEKLEKVGNKWQLRSSTLLLSGPQAGTTIQEHDNFDAVVVASGHYHACRVPDIPGLKEWKSTWPAIVQHSKRYRRPQEFSGKNVLLIGAGVSSTDIAREIAPLANKIYQSSRNSAWDLPVSFLPLNTTRVAEIASFSTPKSDERSKFVTLTDGRVLDNIDSIIICTGYHITYPFLSHLHSDSMPVASAAPTILVTDGTMVHNLHRDIFYIPDPTLAFVGTSYYVATFTLFEFQAIAVASVFTGKAELPSKEQMRLEYEEKLKIKEPGRGFHSLRGEEKEYVLGLVGWINEKRSQDDKVDGHSEAWLEEEKLRLIKIKGMFEVQGRVVPSPTKVDSFWDGVGESVVRLVEV